VTETLHLRPTAELAERVMLPGDPGRALALAQALLDQPRMFNHHRGLWGYTGIAADGAPLTVQSTGMGGPSAAIVLEELIILGARRAVRVGTCGALCETLKLGDIVVAREALAADGTSRALGAETRIADDAALGTALEQLATQGERAAERSVHAGLVVSTDLFYDPRSERERCWTQDALAVEMEAATLFALGSRRGVAVGCLLAVSDRPGGSRRERIGDEELLGVAQAMGTVALAALAPAGRRSLRRA